MTTHAGQNLNVSYPVDDYDYLFGLEDTSFWFQHRNQVIEYFVRKFVPAGTVYDVGGGNGVVAAHLEHQGFSTVLVEPGLAGCENAKARGLQHIIHGRLEDLPPAQAAAIGVFDVVEHIQDRVTFLHLAEQHLAPNGLALLTVPAYQWLWSPEDKRAGHFTRYTLARLAEELTRAGLEVIDSTYFFRFLIAPIFFTRVILRQTENPTKKTAIQATAGTTDSLSGRMVQRLRQQELNVLQAGNRIQWGSSLLVVAKKLTV